MLMTSFSLASLGMAVGSLVKSVGMIEAITNLLTFVVLLGAPVFIPKESLPRALQVFGYALPPTYAARALRSALTGRIDTAFFADAAVLGLATAFSLFALRRWIRWGV
jgi:ABC-2 type transport system permease protein